MVDTVNFSITSLTTGVRIRTLVSAQLEVSEIMGVYIYIRIYMHIYIYVYMHIWLTWCMVKSHPSHFMDSKQHGYLFADEHGLIVPSPQKHSIF